MKTNDTQMKQMNEKSSIPKTCFARENAEKEHQYVDADGRHRRALLRKHISNKLFG